MSVDLNSISWGGVIVLLAVLIAIVGLLIFFVQKKIMIKTKLFSMEQLSAKRNGESDARLIIYSQVREYEKWTGHIERLICGAFLEKLNDLERQEIVSCKLLAVIIRRSLENQLFLDMVANHLVQLDESELDDYAKEKTKAYLSLICNTIADYNDFVLPDIDLNKAVERIDIEELKKCYLQIYRRAVAIARDKGGV